MRQRTAQSTPEAEDLRGDLRHEVRPEAERGAGEEAAGKSAKAYKPKKCRHCKVEFTPRRGLQRVCSLPCAIADTRARESARKAREYRKAKKEGKSRGELLTEAQRVFNEYIRYRDRYEPCISCGRYHQGQYHASHYKSVGANSALRFHELNVHKSCQPCNKHKSGNIGEYRPRLAEKIGKDLVEWIESQDRSYKWTREDALDIKQHYQERLKWLKTQE